MINFSDSIGTKRAIEFNNAYTEEGKPVKWINLTLWADKRTNGDCIQMPVDVIDELINNLTELRRKRDEV